MDPVLEQAKGPHGERRFYPPGKHPALFRHQECLEKLMEISEEVERHELETGKPVDWKNINFAISYHQNAIACFEESESAAKARYLRVGGSY